MKYIKLIFLFLFINNVCLAQTNLSVNNLNVKGNLVSYGKITTRTQPPYAIGDTNDVKFLMWDVKTKQFCVKGYNGIADDDSTDWRLHGNSMTDTTTDFIGTKDATPLLIKTNGISAIKIKENQQIGIGMNPYSTFKLSVWGSLIVSSSIFCFDSVYTPLLHSGFITAENIIRCADSIVTSSDIKAVNVVASHDVDAKNNVISQNTVFGKLGVVAGRTTGNNYIGMDTVNALRMVGTSTVFEDLQFPISTSNRAIVTYPAFVLDSNYYSFYIDTTIAETKCITYYIIQMPHKWKEGSTIYPHFHYKHTTAQGTPTMKIKWKWYNIGSSINQGWKYMNMATTTGTTNNSHQIVYNLNGITAAGKTMSSILLVEVYLGGTSGGTKTCFGYQFDIHYEIDALGSRDEYNK